jgi:plasmid stabilization system protein ParE
MACKINWTPRAWLTYEANIKYLQQAWTEKEISNFVVLVDKKVANLSRNPRTGRPRNKKFPNIRCAVVHKRILLVYKFNH